MEEGDRERERKEREEKESVKITGSAETSGGVVEADQRNWCGHGGKAGKLRGIGNFGKTQVSSAASKFYFYRRPPERKGNGLRNCFYSGTFTECLR